MVTVARARARASSYFVFAEPTAMLLDGGWVIRHRAPSSVAPSRVRL